MAADSDTRLQLVMARLEGCQAILVETGERDTAQLVAMAMLQLRMRLHHIGDDELKALCEALEPESRDINEATGANAMASGERS
jgi:hypothetical protein